MIYIGLDIGSTTIKYIVSDEEGRILDKAYERHYAMIASKMAEIFERLSNKFSGHGKVRMAMSGSAAMGIAEECGIPFVQEVYATQTAIRSYMPATDCAIELGGEDAKILFLSNIPEVRMNGSCAGGTGAFIDQMATLLHMTPEEMNNESSGCEKRYPIASRCGVFAKSDIQPLINQGAKTADICASIFDAVVNQTVAGLAQGRKIDGNVLYLGGPLTFLSGLRESFDRILNIKGICPENSLYYVSLGACLLAEQSPEDTFEEILERVNKYSSKGNFRALPKLFESEEDYEKFKLRHSLNKVGINDPAVYKGDAYLGIDAGSTTVKGALIDKDYNLLLSFYRPNGGNPIPLVKEFLQEIYTKYPDINIVGSAATGYGEDLVRAAFSMDGGVVETVAHYRAATYFQPETDFIIDIGGQDIKCFQLKNGVIDNIFLNEACSSGCGSFLQTFANAMNMSVEEFAKRGLFAQNPVDLGSRCTVFMNSQVKQAQKDGATVEDISAGLSISVVKNAIYKVIRATSPEQLGRHIVVQGGTFYNDAVLRAFELEMGVDVVRPDISGLMGAYGAAIYSSGISNKKSSILSLDQLQNFRHDMTNTVCKGCTNHCNLTINKFTSGRTYIAGNRCDTPVAASKKVPNSFNLYHYKRKVIGKYKSFDGSRGKIGIPLGLNMYDLLPFWFEFFKALDFSVIVSPVSTRDLYLLGHDTIPSDTVCYPAKLMHGHIKMLVEQGVDAVFYPCMTYNLDEKRGDNHFNCPVVAYYPEVVAANMPCVHDVKFIYDYIGLHNTKSFPKYMQKILSSYGYECGISEIRNAMNSGFREYQNVKNNMRREADKIIRESSKKGMPVIVLSGRPYHVDPEINHGIDKLICGLGAAVITEESICDEVKPFKVGVLNQWTYHSRMYAAAKAIADKPDMQLVQLVSFGCGLDAVTTDEVRSICEDEGKIYTQIKIDEIANLGAVKIRLRSLFAAIEQEKAHNERKQN